MLSTSPAPGHLWIVATPLGNPGDLSPRAREVLAGADLILAEDPRRAGLLCSQCNIPARRFLSFHDPNESERQEEVLRLLRQGQNLALVSDAGTPLLADPGYRLVRACRAEGLPVSPVPGPSAPVTALSAAGIPPLPYTFLGFLPRDAAGRRATLSAFARTPGSLIFFERKDRLRESLAQAAELGAKAARPAGGSLTAFERECDNALTRYLGDARRVPFGVETVIAYLYAKEAELTAIRTILAGRRAGLDGAVIRERLRETYV